uniref:Uncharacterized protein n=1 Tax=Cucumis melo TaxID=3656 RepID=A0A9I9E8Y0_CUCME
PLALTFNLTFFTQISLLLQSFVCRAVSLFDIVSSICVVFIVTCKPPPPLLSVCRFVVARVHRRSLLVVSRSVRGRSQAAAASYVCTGSSAAAVQKPPFSSAQVKLLHTSVVQSHRAFYRHALLARNWGTSKILWSNSDTVAAKKDGVDSEDLNIDMDSFGSMLAFNGL